MIFTIGIIVGCIFAFIYFKMFSCKHEYEHKYESTQYEVMSDGSKRKICMAEIYQCKKCKKIKKVYLN